MCHEGCVNDGEDSGSLYTEEKELQCSEAGSGARTSERSEAMDPESHLTDAGAMAPSWDKGRGDLVELC